MRPRRRRVSTGYRRLQDALAAERNMLRTLIDNIPDLVFVKDLESRFVVANKAVANAFGLPSPQQLIGKSDFDFFPRELVEHIYADERALFESGQPHIALEEPNDSLGGVARWFSTTKVPLRDERGRILGLVGACREITEQKRQQEDLRCRNAELAELAARLAQTQRQLVEAGKLAALGALVAGIAHELNTPIGNCIMAAGAFAEQTGAMRAALDYGLKRSMLATYLNDGGKACDVLQRNLQRAAELVHSFKQIAGEQTCSGRQRCALDQLVADSVLARGPLLKGGAVAVFQDVAPRLRLDSYPGSLQQVLMHLIDNAVLHGLGGREGGSIVIVARDGAPGWFELTVSDDGCGMADGDLARVFEPFFTTRLGQGSSGLGLFIVYNIVNGVLGGSITAHSQLGGGTRFVMVLPLCAPQRPAG